MVGSDSVASISGGDASQAVNYRQKLTRLEQSLGIGRLMETVGKSTRLTETGSRIAGEVRLLFGELRAAAGEASAAPMWVLGAGEAWLQSSQVPALGTIVGTHPEWRWEVHNLRARDICQGGRKGEIHFGFVRAGDIHEDDGVERSRTYPFSGYAVVAGDVRAQFSSARELFEWLISQKRPLVQQGSMWKWVREAVSRTLRITKLIEHLEPTVSCETHPQTAAAAERGQSWCIVPLNMVSARDSAAVATATIAVKDTECEMALDSNGPVLAKQPSSAALKTAIGKAAWGAK